MLVTTKSSNSKILAIVIFLALFCTTALYPNVQAENHGVSLRIIEKTGDSEREHVYLLNKYPLEKITVEATGNILTVKQEDVVVMRVILKSSYYRIECNNKTFSKVNDKITFDLETGEQEEITIKIIYEMVTLTVDPIFKNVQVYINNIPRKSLKILKGRKACWAIDKGVVVLGQGFFRTELLAEKTSECITVDDDTIVKIKWVESPYANTFKYGFLILLLVAIGEFAIILYSRRRKGRPENGKS